MLFGGICLLIAALVTNEAPRLSFNARTGGALAYLIVVGAIAGFTAYAYALKHLSVATVSLYAYVNPVIAVLLGTLILKEPFKVVNGEISVPRGPGLGVEVDESKVGNSAGTPIS